MNGPLLAAAAVAFLSQEPDTSAPTTIPEMWTAWCARCHAEDGSGKVSEPTVTVAPMDFTDCRVATPEPDADWELAIAEGGPAVGLSSEMPAFGDTLAAGRIRSFVDHIRQMCAERGWPHGNLNFPRPIFTEKAFPENEFLILPRLTRRKPAAGTDERSARDFDLVSIYERRIGRRAMWEVAVPMASHATTGTTRRQGIGDVELEAKYVLATDRATTRIASAGLEVTLPTGSDVRALGSGTTVFEPYLSLGVVVRDVYLQAETKVELPADAAKADRAFVYGVYIGRDSSVRPTTWTFGAELDGENGELAFTPQARKGLTRTGALAAALGLRLPITERREQGISLVGYVLWEYLEPVKARP